MKEEKTISKKDLKDLGIAAAGLLAVGIVGFFGYQFVFGDKTPKANDNLKVADIKGFGKTPEEALTKFIYLDGNMGDPDKVNAAKLENGTAKQNNEVRRTDAYKEAAAGLYKGSPMFVTNNDKYVKDYSANLSWAEYFNVDKDSIKVSKPSETKKLTTNNGKELDSVEVRGTFLSTKTYFRLKAQDASSDGSFVKIKNEQLFENIKFTLVDEGDNNWRIYDMDDDDTIGSRFATWDPQTEDNYDFSKDEVTSTIKTDLAKEANEGNE